MKKTFLTLASVAALALAPVVAFAEESGSSGPGKNMKGPPNADGYKSEQGRSASEGSDASKGSEKVKGPPNANGASSDSK